MRNRFELSCTPGTKTSTLRFALEHENDCFSDTLQKIPTNERIRIIPLVMWYNTV